MSDLYEFTMAVDLRDDLPNSELAELRWHLGLGPQPRQLTAVPVVDDMPCQLLDGRGPACRVGGALFSTLVSREEISRGGWALTTRQEVHPDDFDDIGRLLVWLAARVHDTHVEYDGSVRLGFVRFLEDDRAHPLKVRDGEVGWPA